MANDDLGVLRWQIDADDSRFDAALDRAEAKVRAFGARLDAAMGGTASGLPGGAISSTFGGALPAGFIGGTPLAGVGWGAANPAWGTQLAQAGTTGFGPAQAYRNLFYQTINAPGFGQPAPGGSPGGGAGGGFFSSNFASRRMVVYGLLATHEMIRANASMAQGDLDSALATTQAEDLKARIDEQRRNYSGFFGSIGGAGLDLFGAGPESFAIDAGKSLKQLETEKALDSARRAAEFGPLERSADLSGNAREQRRIEAIKSADAAHAKYDDSIGFIQKKLDETRDYETGQVTVTPGQRSFWDNFSDNPVTGSDIRRPVYRRGKAIEDVRTRAILGNELQTEKLAVSEADANAGATIQKTYQDFFVEKLKGGISWLARKGSAVNDVIGKAAAFAEANRDRQITLQAADLELAGDPLGAQLKAASKEADPELRAKKQALIRQSWDQDVARINLGLDVDRNLIGARLNRLGPSAEEAISTAGQGMAAALALSQGGHYDQASKALGNAQMALAATRGDYLRSLTYAVMSPGEIIARSGDESQLSSPANVLAEMARQQKALEGAGKQVNLDQLNAKNAGAGGEDSKGVVTAIDKLKTDLLTAIRELVSN